MNWERLLPKNWNDLLSLLLIFIIPALWILSGKGIIETDASVNGALIATWTIIIQYYFRRAPQP